MNSDKTWPAILTLLGIFMIGALHLVAEDSPTQANGILREASIHGGLVVHIGCGDNPELTLTLRASKSFVVQGLEIDAEKVSKARKVIQDAGRYGPVSVEHWSGGTLPYVDNLVNLVVAPADMESTTTAGFA